MYIHFLKKEDNQFIQDSNYLIRIINEKKSIYNKLDYIKNYFIF